MMFLPVFWVPGFDPDPSDSPLPRKTQPPRYELSTIFARRAIVTCLGLVEPALKDDHPGHPR